MTWMLCGSTVHSVPLRGFDSSSGIMSSGDGRDVSTTRCQRRPGHPELEDLGHPAHVHHDVDVLLLTLPAQRERQHPRVRVVPAGRLELAAVPRDVGQAALVHLAGEERARRCTAECALRKAIISWKNRTISRVLLGSVQSNQLISLSWQ